MFVARALLLVQFVYNQKSIRCTLCPGDDASASLDENVCPTGLLSISLLSTNPLPATSPSRDTQKRVTNTITQTTTTRRTCVERRFPFGIHQPPRIRTSPAFIREGLIK